MNYALQNLKRNGKIMWRLLRPHTLTASFIPVSIGTALAIAENHFHLPIFLAMMLASILIQSATNMFNEYYDYQRGLDTADSVGIGGAIVRDGVNPKLILNLAMLFIMISVLLGIYITLNSSIWIAVVGVISIAVGYLYTGGPYPIAYSPFGELFAGVFMGLVIILITFYIQTGGITTESVLFSIPTSILISAILTANNIRDLDGDQKNGRRTLVILLGKERAIKLLLGMFLLSYLWMIGMVLLQIAPFWVLLTLIALPKAIEAIRIFKENQTPRGMMPAMKATAELHTYFGFFVTIGILIHHLIQ